MATKIFETEDLTLDDGNTVEMRPLKISSLRKFMKKFAELSAAEEDNDKSFDVLVACAAIAFEQWNKELANKKWVEDNLDLNDLYDVIRVASGIDLRAQGNV